MTRKEYLESILTVKQIEQINYAIKHKKPILITGSNGPTGKSTLATYLRQFGADVHEPHDMLTISLDKPLGDRRINNVLDTIED